MAATAYVIDFENGAQVMLSDLGEWTGNEPVLVDALNRRFSPSRLPGEHPNPLAEVAHAAAKEFGGVITAQPPAQPALPGVRY